MGAVLADGLASRCGHLLNRALTADWRFCACRRRLLFGVLVTRSLLYASERCDKTCCERRVGFANNCKEEEIMRREKVSEKGAREIVAVSEESLSDGSSKRLLPRKRLKKMAQTLTFRTGSCAVPHFRCLLGAVEGPGPQDSCSGHNIKMCKLLAVVLSPLPVHDASDKCRASPAVQDWRTAVAP